MKNVQRTMSITALFLLFFNDDDGSVICTIEEINKSALPID